VFEQAHRYRGHLERTLDDRGWTRAQELAARKARTRLQDLRREGVLRPSWSGAAWTLARTALSVVLPLWLAGRTWSLGVHVLALPLVFLAGLGCYGAIVIMHDLAHSSFTPKASVDRALGRVMAPLFLLEFESLRSSHLDHHRFSQSLADPKSRIAGKKAPPVADHASDRLLDRLPSILRPLVHLGVAVTRLPLRLRHPMYLFVFLFVLGPILVCTSGEFVLWGRDWRRLASWLSATMTFAVAACLYALSPMVLLFSACALWVGWSFVLLGFMTHLSPNQIYWAREEHQATPADALNVSDVHAGWLVRVFGHGFSEHHSIHHLFPAIPCYRLAQAKREVSADIDPVKAPELDLLDPWASALLFENMLLATVKKSDEAWDFFAAGRVKAIGVEREDVDAVA
jgi:fatty acid desaturase